MRRHHKEDNEHDEEHVIGSATICEQQGDDGDFPIPRKDYMNAPLSGDAAIMKQLKVHGEFSKLDIKNPSCSEPEERDTSRKCYQSDNAPAETTTLPLFPMIQLKRRRVVYYILINVDDVEVDAPVDTGACLSAIPLNVYDKILGLAGSNILICKEKPIFKLQAANGETCPILFSAIISFYINGFTENYQFQEEFLILKVMNTPYSDCPSLNIME